MLRNMLLGRQNREHRCLQSGDGSEQPRCFRTLRTIPLGLVAIGVEEISLPAVAFGKDILILRYVLEIGYLIAMDQEGIHLRPDSCRSSFDGSHPGKGFGLEKGSITIPSKTCDRPLHKCSNHRYAPITAGALRCREDFPAPQLRHKGTFGVAFSINSLVAKSILALLV